VVVQPQLPDDHVVDDRLHLLAAEAGCMYIASCSLNQ
jgi:hypothetical protein